MTYTIRAEMGHSLLDFSQLLIALDEYHRKYGDDWHASDQQRGRTCALAELEIRRSSPISSAEAAALQQIANTHKWAREPDRGEQFADRVGRTAAGSRLLDTWLELLMTPTSLYGNTARERIARATAVLPESLYR